MGAPFHSRLRELLHRNRRASVSEQQHSFIGRDFTALKETERRLRRSEARNAPLPRRLARLNADLEGQ
jgi:hypothetical protein